MVLVFIVVTNLFLVAEVVARFKHPVAYLEAGSISGYKDKEYRKSFYL